MAVTLGDALLALGVDDSGLDRGLAAAESKTTSVLSNLAGGAASLVGGAMVAGVAAVAAGIGVVGAQTLNVSEQIRQAARDAVGELGVTEERANEIAQAAGDVWANNFTGSVEEAQDAVVTAMQIMGDAAEEMSSEQLSQVTQQALAIKDAFEVEVSESILAATALVKNGVAADMDEAMNIITAGFQNGLNASDDFLDTIREYADDFGRMGYSGEEALALINRGLEAGIWNTDKIGDALNEFGVNIRDPAIRDGIEELDAGILGIFDQFQDGAITQAEAFDQMSRRLSEIEDPIVRDQLGVMLFRSMWEDLGEEAMLSLGNMEGGLIDVDGATDKLNMRYTDLKSFFQGSFRQGILALTPLGDMVLDLANKAVPFLQEGFEVLEGFLSNTLVPGVQKFVSGLGENEGLQEAGKNVIRFVKRVGSQITVGVARVKKGLEPVFTFVRDTALPLAKEFAQRIQDEVIPAFRDAVSGGDISGFGDALDNVFAWIKDEAIPTLEEWLPIIIDELIPGLVLIGEIVGTTLATVFTVWGNVVEFASNHLNILVPIVAAVGLVIAAINAPILLIIGAIVLLATAWANNWGDIQGKTDAVVTWFNTNILTRIQDFFSAIAPLWEAVQAAFDGDWEEFGRKLREGLEGAQQWVNNRKEEWRTWVGDIFQSLADKAIEKLTTTDWAKVGRDVIWGIIEGLNSMHTNAQNAMSGLGRAMMDALIGFFEIASPAKKPGREIGVPVADGVINYMADRMKGFGKAMADAIKMPDMSGTQQIGGLLGNIAGGGSSNTAYVTMNYNGNNAPRDKHVAERHTGQLGRTLRSKGFS